MSKNSKIEWTDATWNPVWGCKAGCYYCYAKKRSKRFASVISKKETSDKIDQLNIEKKLKNFEPVFLWSNFHKFFRFSKKPSKIFIGSMSDIAYWKPEWIEMVADVIRYYPQHTFQLLTKFPEVYETLNKIMPGNVWFGVTVTNIKDLDKLVVEHNSGRNWYVSFEPLMEDLSGKMLSSDLHMFDWVIIGTMSGRDRTQAQMDWVRNIVEVANAIYGIPVFVKQLEIDRKVEKDISKFPEDLQIRQYPK